ncbi:DUF5689 domain-containing protein [Flavobacterium aquicola]|uniref:Uncharacterized protein DUF5017 n=1 Tax=Flavobacterium aquicola TaxID=1682742 RepID=A0A3E0ELE5_9FLAO|nr:DUF5689 domain-containing protein [Flavobacterium aquicola]REG99047.1 uncharacterized protein DUF5017 [Flavobacterium aquicola]
MKLKITIVLLGTAILLTSCAEEFSVPKLSCNQPDLKVNRTVEEIRSSTNSIVTQYKYDDIIEAYVVSSDEEGNFFKTISFQTLETNTAPALGFSAPVDASNTYIDFRVGNKVYIKMKDLYTDFYFGGMRIGNIFVNSYDEGGVGRIPQNDYKKVLNASCTIIEESQLVKQITIEEALNDTKINTLVELKDVEFTESALGRHYYEETNDIGGATNWNLRDKTGNQIIFRTSGYAAFSDHLVPEGNGNIRGILTKFGIDYQLMVRSEKDIIISGNRNIPFFAEDFQSVKHNVNFALPGWSNIVEKASKLWKSMVYSSNGYAEFNTTSTSAAENIAWLVSPKINLEDYKNPVLSFRSAQHDLKTDSPQNTLEVYISTNFEGTLAGATWTKLAAKVSSLSTPSREFISSGGIDLSAYSGNINIAFKYIGSGKNKTLNGAFMVDDIKIFGEKP